MANSNLLQHIQTALASSTNEAAKQRLCAAMGTDHLDEAIRLWVIRPHKESTEKELETLLAPFLRELAIRFLQSGDTAFVAAARKYDGKGLASHIAQQASGAWGTHDMAGTLGDLFGIEVHIIFNKNEYRDSNAVTFVNKEPVFSVVLYNTQDTLWHVSRDDCYDVTHDGNCLYHAFAKILRRLALIELLRVQKTEVGLSHEDERRLQDLQAWLRQDALIQVLQQQIWTRIENYRDYITRNLPETERASSMNEHLLDVERQEGLLLKRLLALREPEVLSEQEEKLSQQREHWISGAMEAVNRVANTYRQEHVDEQTAIDHFQQSAIAFLEKMKTSVVQQSMETETVRQALESQFRAHLNQEAPKHFKHPDFGWRLAADILLLITGLGLIIFPARWALGKGTLFSLDKTQEHKAFEEAISIVPICSSAA